MSSRPYFIMYQGVARMVEATSPAAAVHHVVDKAITELRPARGPEVLQWMRAGHKVEVAGEKPKDDSQGDLVVEDGGFNGSDARVWLIEQFADLDQAKDALHVFDRIRGYDEMRLQDFEEMIPISGEFICAIVGEVPSDKPINLAEISNELKDAAMPFDQVVRLIGEAKRRELFEDAPAATAE